MHDMLPQQIQLATTILLPTYQFDSCWRSRISTVNRSSSPDAACISGVMRSELQPPPFAVLFGAWVASTAAQCLTWSQTRWCLCQGSACHFLLTKMGRITGNVAVGTGIAHLHNLPP